MQQDDNGGVERKHLDAVLSPYTCGIARAARMEAAAGSRAAPGHVGGRDRGAGKRQGHDRQHPAHPPRDPNLGSGRRSAQRPQHRGVGLPHAQAAQRPARGRMERRRQDPQAVPGTDAHPRRDPAAAAVAAGLPPAGRGGRRHQGGDAGAHTHPPGARSADLVEQARRREASGQHAAHASCNAGSRPGGSRRW